MIDKKRTPVGEIRLVVWSDDSVSTTWSTFLRGESLDGYVSGNYWNDDVIDFTEKKISEIIETVKRNEKDEQGPVGATAQ